MSGSEKIRLWKLLPPNCLLECKSNLFEDSGKHKFVALCSLLSGFEQ